MSYVQDDTYRRYVRLHKVLQWVGRNERLHIRIRLLRDSGKHRGACRRKRKSSCQGMVSMRSLRLEIARCRYTDIATDLADMTIEAFFMVLALQLTIS